MKTREQIRAFDCTRDLIFSCCKFGPLPAMLTAVLIAVLSFSAPRAAADCAGLTGMTLKDTKITATTIVPAKGMIPEYCKVLGSIHNLPQSTILFEVSLPTTKWNGMYYVVGGGGYNGSIPNLTQALEEGYAAAGSDTGHEAKDENWAVNNLDAQINYAYLATHVVTQLGKEILRAFYTQHERHSYFVGCSNGGKMALAEVQRYPDDFDAAVVGDPPTDRNNLLMEDLWDAQAVAHTPIPSSKIPAIEKATMNACRETGGAVNGVLMTPGRCKFDPKTIICPSGDGPTCLTAGQAQTLQKILHGAVNSAGVSLTPGIVPGHEDDYPSFITRKDVDKPSSASTWGLPDVFMRQFVFGLSFDPVKQFNWDTSPAAMVPLADQNNNDNPDLSAFKAHGGKLIVYHGWADHSISALRTIEYYEDVIGTMGKDRAEIMGEPNAYSVTDFMRVFLVPGMHHCGNGPGANVFGGAGQGIPPQHDAQHDVVMALDQWVEDGIPPSKIIASHLTNGTVDHTMILCPYPQLQVYNGAGDMNLAESFHCEDKSFRWAIESAPYFRKQPPGAATAPAKKRPVQQSTNN